MKVVIVVSLAARSILGVERPGERSGSKAVTNPNRSASRDVRILLVDDSEAIRFALSRYLESHGYTIVVADSAAAAIAEIHREAPLDFILTDFLLPDADGLAVALAARNRKIHPCIYLITGWVLEDDRLESVDRVLPKPVVPGELLRFLAEDSAARSAASVDPEIRDE